MRVIVYTWSRAALGYKEVGEIEDELERLVHMAVAKYCRLSTLTFLPLLQVSFRRSLAKANIPP
jgi:hypothetical protein